MPKLIAIVFPNEERACAAMNGLDEMRTPRLVEPERLRLVGAL